MVQAFRFLYGLKIWRDTSGQDILEYGCFMAAILLLYAAFSPAVANDVVQVFTKVSNTLTQAASV